MKNIGKLILSALAITLVSIAASAQQIPQQKGFSSLSPAYRLKLERDLNNGRLDSRLDTLKALPPGLRPYFPRHNSRMPGLENMPYYNPSIGQMENALCPN